MKHRNDLQGLRAVAVLLVALGHAGIRFLKGGFIGVDVFFVLSGFLITGLLLSEAFERRSISLLNFYVRRALRILPAAVLALIVTDVVAYLLLNLARAKQVMWDSIWSSFFAANIHFAREASEPPSPLLHFWTLGVEEQFYLVWPLLLAVFGVASIRRLQHRPRAEPIVDARATFRLLAVITVAGLASLAWSVHYTSTSPAAAYYSSLARAWELALGAALAIAASSLTDLSSRVRTILGWSGISAIACSAVLYSGSTPLPGYAALLPTVGTALVIAAGIADLQPRFGVGRVLEQAPLRYVGDRSYSFYLWHWPALLIATGYAGHGLSVKTNLMLLFVAFGVSVVTYRFFENPIRHMRSGRSGAARRASCRNSSRRKPHY